MTKEEIIDELEIRSQGDYYREDVSRIMDQYAAQQGIAFAEWMGKQGFRYLKSVNAWVSKNEDSYSPEDLYNLFLQSQQDK